MSRSNKPLEYLVRKKKNNKCRDERTFNKAVQKVIGRKPTEVVLSGKWFEATFSLYSRAVREFKKAGFQVKLIKFPVKSIN